MSHANREKKYVIRIKISTARLAGAAFIASVKKNNSKKKSNILILCQNAIYLFYKKIHVKFSANPPLFVQSPNPVLLSKLKFFSAPGCDEYPRKKAHVLYVKVFSEKVIVCLYSDIPNKIQSIRRKSSEKKCFRSPMNIMKRLTADFHFLFA